MAKDVAIMMLLSFQVPSNWPEVLERFFAACVTGVRVTGDQRGLMSD